MSMLPHSPEAYQLLQDGVLALAQVEHTGMRVDERYLRNALKRTRREIEEGQKALQSSKVMRVWRRTFKDRTNFNSTIQLGKVLFDVMEIAESPGKTEGGQHKTDEDSLITIDHPFIADYLAIKKKQKGVAFLEGIQREVVDGILRPSFNLHIPKTYRSSSDAPNFQNLPVRNEELSKLVRRCIVARKGRCLVEIDYSGVEVKVSYCLHKDPRMRRYLEDPNSDMHRDMAIECFMLPKKGIPPEWWKGKGKAVRHSAKNQFVFPQFYGNYWMACARDMWREIRTRGLVAPDGTPMEKWLKRQGIKELGPQDEKGKPLPGTFEGHIAEVEHRFWNKRFKVYTEWKKKHYAQYLLTGWFQTVTGFICSGYMKRNEVINYPVQGPAFHCLLWSLIQLVGTGDRIRGELKKRRMRAKIVGQIHDSIVGDVPEEEVDDYLALCYSVMVPRLMSVWEWIITQLEVEAEVTPVGGSWVDKEVRKIEH